MPVNAETEQIFPLKRVDKHISKTMGLKERDCLEKRCFVSKWHISSKCYRTIEIVVVVLVEYTQERTHSSKLFLCCNCITCACKAPRIRNSF